MNEGIIVTRYTKALYELAEEVKQSDEIKRDIDLLSLTINESFEFKQFLISPVIKQSKKIQLFNQIFNGKIEQITLNFLELLAKNRREHYLPNICRYYNQYFKAQKGIKEGILTTAVEIEPEHLQEINRILKKKFNITVDLDQKVDASLIGGFKLTIEDTQIDASVSTKLKKIKKELTNL